MRKEKVSKVEVSRTLGEKGSVRVSDRGWVKARKLFLGLTSEISMGVWSPPGRGRSPVGNQVSCITCCRSLRRRSCERGGERQERSKKQEESNLKGGRGRPLGGSGS